MFLATTRSRPRQFERLEDRTVPAVAVFSTDQPVALVPGGTVVSPVAISSTLQVADLDVRVQIGATAPQDLTVSLISPNGTRVRLFDHQGVGGSGFERTLFDDEAFFFLSQATPPYTGRFAPTDSLSDFDGLDLHGTWLLEVLSDSSGGQIDGWSLIASPASNFPSIDTPIPIPDLHTITSTIFVDESFGVQDVNVRLDLGHPISSELVVALIAPDGRRVELIRDIGFIGFGFFGTILDQDAPVNLFQGFTPYLGNFRPTSGFGQPEGLSLTDLEGIDAFGLWTLEITDLVEFNDGFLECWALDLERPQNGLPLVTTTLRGVVFDDVDGDRVQDVGENGLAGVSVFLDSIQNGQMDPSELSATSRADGSYVIEGLAGFQVFEPTDRLCPETPVFGRVSGQTAFLPENLQFGEV